jgi:ABC-type uncharacterized transport system permease subunit
MQEAYGSLPRPSEKPPRAFAMIGKIRKRLGDWLEFIDSFRISEKISGIVALLVLVLTLLVAMSIQTVRLTHEYRRNLAASATTAINVGGATH